MNFARNGLAILRRISPPHDLEEWLTANGDIYAIETGSGRDARTILHVDDDVPRDEIISDQIVGTFNRSGSLVGGCTDGWSVVDQDYRIRAFYTSLVRAQAAVSTATTELKTEFQIEGLEDDESKPEKKSKSEPVAVPA